MAGMHSDAFRSWEIDVEQPADIPGISLVHQHAFQRPDEAQVVDCLRHNCPVFYSWVARVGQQVVGHVLFTPARILQPDGPSLIGLGLAPLAVLPEIQGQGIGSALCQEGLRRIDPETYPFVVVLGHPGYYPRFGFKPAALYGILCSYLDGPEDSFMIRILNPARMAGVSGVAYYRPEFDSIS
jgi:putative acetyltransferase